MKTAVFIDGANLFYIEKSLDFSISFERMAKYFRKNYDIVNLYYYTGYDPEIEKEMDFFDNLALMGYTVRKKPLKIIRTGPKTNDIIKKANLDVEIVLDMINISPLYNRLILISGDSDFVRALEQLRGTGKEIIVISQKKHISLELLNCADNYLDIKNLQNFIQKKPRYLKP